LRFLMYFNCKRINRSHAGGREGRDASGLPSRSSSSSFPGFFLLWLLISCFCCKGEGTRFGLIQFFAIEQRKLDLFLLNAHLVPLDTWRWLSSQVICRSPC
jgi:hypothetical protein